MPRGKYDNHARGDRCARWNNGRIYSSHGYAKIRVGRSHPLADPNGYAYEHLLVWVGAGNPKPRTDEIIHHINGVKTDNRLENLCLLSRSKHNAIHDAIRERNNNGQFVSRLLDGRAWNEMPEVRA